MITSSTLIIYNQAQNKLTLCDLFNKPLIHSKMKVNKASQVMEHTMQLMCQEEGIFITLS